MELWDLYTENREFTGKRMFRGEKTPEGYYRIVVHACIFNSQDKLLIQQRKEDKIGFPNMWDVSIGGSAISGETSNEACQREIKEELGIELDLKKVRPALTINFHSGFDDFYIIKTDLDLTDLTLQEEEVKDARWASKDEVIYMLKKDIFVPYESDFINLLFKIKDKVGVLK